MFTDFLNGTTLSTDPKFDVPILAHYFRYFHFLESATVNQREIEMIIRTSYKIAITKIDIFDDTRHSRQHNFLHKSMVRIFTFFIYMYIKILFQDIYIYICSSMVDHIKKHRETEVNRTNLNFTSL